jgi:ATP-dependent Clp protease ATP-binding subunit ClpX
MVDETNKNNNTTNKTDECRCYVCHRTESECGHMLHMPNNINVCDDCMQKTFDSISGMNLGPFWGMDVFNATNGNIDALKSEEDEVLQDTDDSQEESKKDSKKDSNKTPIGNVFDFSGFPGMINLSP